MTHGLCVSVCSQTSFSPRSPPRHKQKAGSEPDEQFTLHTSSSPHLFRRHLKHSSTVRPARASCTNAVWLVQKAATSQTNCSPCTCWLTPSSCQQETSGAAGITNVFTFLHCICSHANPPLRPDFKCRIYNHPTFLSQISLRVMASFLTCLLSFQILHSTATVTCDAVSSVSLKKC